MKCLSQQQSQINHKTIKLHYLLDDGRLHKAININKKMHIIEEMVLFHNSQPVQHIELDTEKVQKNAALRKKINQLA